MGVTADEDHRLAMVEHDIVLHRDADGASLRAERGGADGAKRRTGRAEHEGENESESEQRRPPQLEGFEHRRDAIAPSVDGRQSAIVGGGVSCSEGTETSLNRTEMGSGEIRHRGGPILTAERDGPAHTAAQHRIVAERCAEVFAAKLADYGPAWRTMRLISIVDQIYIKARRIRQLEQTGGRAQIADPAIDEYVGVLNYAVMSLLHLDEGELNLAEHLEETRFEPRWTDREAARARFLAVTGQALALLERKNHDYGEAWRQMAIESITDELLSRCVRIKGLLEGAPDMEAVSSQLFDTINYAAFALIRLRYADAPSTAAGTAR